MNFREELQINANPSTIYKVYKEVDHWNDWDPGVTTASLDNGLSVGSTGTLTPTKGPKAKIEITEATENRSFTTSTKLPFCSMRFIHHLEPVDSGTLATHDVEFEGLLSPIFGQLIGRQIHRDLPATLHGLKTKSEMTT